MLCHMDHLVCMVLPKDVDRFIFDERGVMDSGPTAKRFRCTLAAEEMERNFASEGGRRLRW